jgi:hypothetical protein
MKKVVFTILLTLFCSCVTVNANPAIDALEQEIEYLRQNLHEKSVEDLVRLNKLRDILHSMKQQEKDNKVIHEWEEYQKNRPCESLDRETLELSECVKVLL